MLHAVVIKHKSLQRWVNNSANDWSEENLLCCIKMHAPLRKGTMQLVTPKSVFHGRNNKCPATLLKWSHMTSQSVGRRLKNRQSRAAQTPNLIPGEVNDSTVCACMCVQDRKCFAFIQFLFFQGATAHYSCKSLIFICALPCFPQET